MQIASNNMTGIDNNMTIIAFIIEKIIYILLPVIFWLKYENISNKIIGNIPDEKILLNLNYKEFLSFGIIILSLFLIVIRIPMILTLIIHNISNYLSSPHWNWKSYLIEFISQLISQLLAIIIPILFIKYREKIIEIIHKEI
jgi:H+/gluconate symporter-like permease